MNATLWIVGVVVALLAALNAIFWGYTIRDVGDPQLTFSFIFKLIFNKWFILALASALTASLFSYVVLSQMGVLAGRFFLSLSMVAVILVCALVLGERLTLKEWVGIALILAGAIVIGRP